MTGLSLFMELSFLTPLYYNIILSYSKQDYWLKSSHRRNYIDELYIQILREDIIFGTKNIEPCFEENHKERSSSKFSNLRLENNTLQYWF